MDQRLLQLRPNQLRALLISLRTSIRQTGLTAERQQREKQLKLALVQAKAR